MNERPARGVLAMMKHRYLGHAALLILAACAAPAPSQEHSSSRSPNASPTFACGGLATADCRAAESAALNAVSGNGTATHIDLGGGVFCTQRGQLFGDCPGIGPAPEGGDWIGNAVVTFAGSPVQAYLNIAKNGQTVTATMITQATPQPTS